MAHEPHHSPSPAVPRRRPAVAVVGAGLLVAALTSFAPADAAAPGSSAGSATRGAPTAAAASTTSTAAPSATRAAATRAATVRKVAAPTAAATTVAAAPSSPAGRATSLADLPAPTVQVGTAAELQAAMAAAKPGTVIGLRAGTYSGPFTAMTSGTAANPIVLRPVGSQAVTLTASLPMPACSATGPDGNRTLSFRRGASHWTVAGLAIRGGVMISSEGADQVQTWYAKKIDSGDWQARRAVPGRGTNSPSSRLQTVPYMADLLGVDIKPSDGISLLDNTITLKGIHARLSRDGVISGTTVTDIACGTGPGIWLTMFSDGWRLTGNTVSRVARSTASHFMHEAIRLGNGTNYTTVSGNTVTDLPTGGRGYSTDQDSSYNTISGNRASALDIAYNDQMAGWSNSWIGNTATDYRVAGFSFRTQDGKYAAPQANSSTRGVVVRCNLARSSTGRAFQAGGMSQARISSNGFDSAFFGKGLRTYFGSQGNTWDGRSSLPSDRDLTGKVPSSC